MDYGRRVSDLVSIVFPQAPALPVWPALEVGVPDFLTLYVGLPLGISLLIAAFAGGAGLIRSARGGKVTLSEPLWLGERTRKSLTSDPIPSETGGASARW